LIKKGGGDLRRRFLLFDGMDLFAQEEEMKKIRFEVKEKSFEETDNRIKRESRIIEQKEGLFQGENTEHRAENKERER
jgi:hypothetical protein